MSLSTRVTLLSSAIIMALTAQALVGDVSSHAADDCITKPTGAPPQGDHWYYRTDRTTQRQCWYLAPHTEKVRALVQESGLVVQPPVTPKLVPSPGGQAFGAAPAETTTIATSAIKDDSSLVAGPVEPPRDSEEVSVKDRLADEVRMSTSRAQENSVKEASGVAATSGLGLTSIQRTPELSYVLAILAGVLVLIAIIVRSMHKVSAMRQSPRTKLRDQSHAAKKSSCPEEYVESPSLAERIESELNNLDAAAHADAGLAKMDPTNAPVREYSWVEIQTSLRLLLHELEQRQIAVVQTTSGRHAPAI